MTVHEHPDSDRLWLAEGVRCGQIAVGGKRGLTRRHVALCCEGWVERVAKNSDDRFGAGVEIKGWSEDLNQRRHTKLGLGGIGHT